MWYEIVNGTFTNTVGDRRVYQEFVGILPLSINSSAGTKNKGRMSPFLS